MSMFDFQTFDLQSKKHKRLESLPWTINLQNLKTKEEQSPSDERKLIPISKQNNVTQSTSERIIVNTSAAITSRLAMENIEKQNFLSISKINSKKKVSEGFSKELLAKYYNSIRRMKKTKSVALLNKFAISNSVSSSSAIKSPRLYPPGYFSDLLISNT